MSALWSNDASPEIANLAYYDANAQAYAERTNLANLIHLYEPFLSLLPPRARILDVGCGGGRDLRAFRELGFIPFGIEPSTALAKIARQHSGVDVAATKVELLETEDAFDGAWACASLLHLAKTELLNALTRLRRSLVRGGVMFLSVQAGSGEGYSPDGRFYSRYEELEFRDAVLASGFEILRTWQTSDSLSSRTSITWINLLAQKPFER